MKMRFGVRKCLMAVLLTSGVHWGLAESALKDVFKDYFLVGGALNRAEFSEEDPQALRIIQKHFNTITPEDALKWASLHPQPDVYEFEAPDRYVAFGEKHRLFIVGHTLVWHNQTPGWVFQDAAGKPADRETLLKRMQEHISKVVGRYKGRIKGWDVVNEALDDDGGLRQTPWLKIIGPDYIAKAFEYAHQADPAAELYYNDFSLENEPKRKGAVALIRKLKAQGVPVAGVGIQAHDKMDWPTPAQVDAAISELGKLGVKVMITELDIDVLPPATRSRGADVTLKAELQSQLNPYPNGLPDSVQQALAKRYADLFAVFVKHRGVLSRVTFWGVTDGGSWLNRWPVRGRTSYPLLFDRQGQPKPAFEAVVRTATP